MSTKKRILRNIGILILAVILGGVVGFIMAHFEHSLSRNFFLALSDA